MDFTTIEHLQLAVSATYGAVIKYEDKVFVTDITWRGGFTAMIFEFIETPEETELGDIECRLAPWAEANETFKDNGHALKWCFEQIK
jgi:hypothetical protein